MQALTAKQISQLNITAQSAWDALILVEDTFCHGLDGVMVALTRDRAFNIYHATWIITKHAVILAMAAAFYAGVLARDVWELLNDYVEHCLEEELAYVEISPVVPTVAPESAPDVWDLPVETVCLLTSESDVSVPTMPLLMPANEAVQTKARKTTTKKTTMRKTGGKTKSTKA